MIILVLQTTGIMMVMGGVLAALLVIAERYLADYGECNIDINGKRQEKVKGGSSLLSSLNSRNIYLASACGGRGSCGFCKCKVIEGGGPLLPTEKPFLSPEEISENIRLSCQVKIKKDIKIELPEAIFNIRKFKAKVSSIRDYTHDIKELTLDLKDSSTINFKAGQYIQLHSARYGKVKQSVSRAYSISSNQSSTDLVQVIIRLVPKGICTTWVHEYLKEGDDVEFTGPYGDFYIRDTDKDIIFIAGGSGMAPIKSMLEWLLEINSPRKIFYFFGARCKEDLYLTEYLYEFENKLADFEYHPVLSQPGEEDKWQGKTGYITPYLKDVIRDSKNTEAYLCGSPGMINSVSKGLKEYGISESDIFYDSF
ncbi:MAG: 2Fe-2S iron-sulfur cluster binding domain-containing protein [Candidatus Cloacimonetes bacterium]|nr:2Fe-2S iron-sulfur cluster binding domain-containing protein [Candidatus Cloacimonadota bacterium]